jgi:hypothetical protein
MTFVATSAFAQKSRSSVSAAEVTGTFRSYFGGKFKNEYDEIRIASAGRGKLHIAMDLLFPMMVHGELSANIGELDGEAAITGDTAVYESAEFGACKITIKFLRPGTIDVGQDGADGDCGFGHNVMASGTYRKVSSRKPSFERDHD